MVEDLKHRLFKLRYPIAASLVLALISFTHFAFISLIGAIILWALYWPLGRSMSLLTRLILAFCLTTCIQQLFGFIFYLLRIHYTDAAATLIELIVLLPALDRGIVRVKLLTKDDLAALVVSLTSMFILAWSALHGGPLLQQLVRQSTTGYDGVQHISLTLTLYDNKGYMYGDFDQLKNKILYNNLPSYPQGWSLSSSLWWHSVDSDVNIQTHPAATLLLYFASLTLWFGVLIYLFCRLILRLVEVIRGRINGMAEIIGAITFTLLAEIMVLIGVPYNSFVSFYPALVFPLALTLLIIDLLVVDKIRKSPGVFLVNGLMLSGGVAFSWLLAAPGAYIMVLIALLIYFNGSLIEAIKWVISRKLVLVSSVILLLLASGQGFMQLLYGVKGLVNYPGGAGILHNLVLFSLLIFTLGFAAIIKNKPIKNVVMSALPGIFIISGAVYIYQFATTGQANYFSTKITFVAFTLIAAFGFAFLISIISDHIAEGNGFTVKALAMVGLAVFIPVASNMDLSTSVANGIGPINYMQGKRFLSEYSASQMAGLMLDHDILHSNFVLYKHLNFDEDVISTHFIQMTSRGAIPYCNGQFLGDLLNQWNLDPQKVISCSDGKPFYVITSQKYYVSLKQDFANYPNIKVILSN